MTKANRDKVDALLTSLFDAERTVRNLHDDLAGAPRQALLDAIGAAVAAARAEDDEDEQTLRLVRLASLLGELDGDRTVDLLIEILASESGEARHAAGEMLTGLAFDRFKEVALGVERALGRLPAGSPALPELPFLLVEVPEPGVTKLLGKFLAHQDPEAVAAAIEASLELGDPSLAGALSALEKDARAVDIEGDGGESGRITIGELATEAIAILSNAKD